MQLRFQWVAGCALVALMAVGARAASLTVYDNLNNSAVAGYSEFNTGDPIFGDALNLTQGGALESLGLTLYNPSSNGNTGSILTGATIVTFFDNTVPYGGGPLNDPVLATVEVPWDFSGSGGLPPGFFSADTVDMSALGIVLPQDIFVTQEFIELTGTSTRNGIIFFGDPGVGSSPDSFYISSTTTAEGLYSVGTIQAQVGYSVAIDAVGLPPAVWAGLAMLAGMGAVKGWRRAAR